MSILTRRETVFAVASLVATPGFAAGKLRPTPARTEGPFYPDRLPADTDADLVKVAGRVRQAGGEILSLGGRVLGVGGEPIQGAVVEIWQVDANGRYIHSADARRGASDEGFQGSAGSRWIVRAATPSAPSGPSPIRGGRRMSTTVSFGQARGV